MSNDRVFIDQDTYIRMIYDAAENNGVVLLEAREFPIFEIKMSVDFAKKERDKIEKQMLKACKEN